VRPEVERPEDVQRERPEGDDPSPRPRIAADDAPRSATTPATWPALVRAWGRMLAGEGVLVLIGFALYRLVAGGAPDAADSAFRHARDVLAAEATLGLDVERSLNGWWAQFPTLTVAANLYYVALHFTVPFVVLGLLVLRRPDRYHVFRAALIVMSFLGLTVAWLWPAAPPRLLPGAGFVDTLATTPVLGIGGPEGTASIENPYAAMPSMHVGWAVWVAVAVTVLTGRTWLRLLGLLHPVLTALDIVVTGNHFLADAPAGALTAALGFGVAIWWYRLRPPRPLPPLRPAGATRRGVGHDVPHRPTARSG
jgi:hypothetical protein